MKFILYFFVISQIMLFSCASRKATPDTYEKRQLVFGSGGGVTGMVTTYYLLENGQLFKKGSMDSSYELVKKVPGKVRKAMFATMEQMKLSDMEINHPGNMYYFIQTNQEGGKGRVCWGEQGYKISDDVKSFYQSLTKITQ